MSFPENPHISVLLPTRNGMPHVQEALAGLCAQTYKNFTVLVQDGLSTDGTLEYLRGLKTDFKMDIVSEHDGSLTIGYARCMKRMTGDLMVFAACDEVFDADAFARYVQWYQQHPDAIFIYGGVRIEKEDQEKKRTKYLCPAVDFNLFDYIRLRMCPTMGGAFNARALGKALCFDESLASCPDFELVTRLALQYGSHRIIAKKAFTMWARGDRSSMTYRAEAHDQFAKDKATIIERLVHGPLAQRFEDYMRRYFVYSLHMMSANIVNDVAPDSTTFAAHVKAAEENLPGTNLAGRLAHQSRLLSWDEDRGGVSDIVSPHPAEPYTYPLSEEQALSPEHFEVRDKWADVGARLSVQHGQAFIETVKINGFSALLPLSLAKLDFGNNWYWVCVTARTVQGIASFLLTGTKAEWQRDYDEFLVMHQKKLVASESSETFYLPLKPCLSAALVVANYKQNDPSQIHIQNMALVALSKTAMPLQERKAAV